MRSVLSSIALPLAIFSLAVFSNTGDAHAQSPRSKGAIPEGAVQILRAMSNPEEVALAGSERQEKLATSLGPIQLRWARSNEALFGRTPVRAVVEAVNAVARTIKGSGWPSRVQNLNINWSIVFMSEKDLAAQMPAYLVSECHPGWFTPPGNIYIVAERVAKGCGGGSSSTSVADGILADVIVHEMGHAVEFYTLQEGFGNDRMRAEGFATWFERYAGKNTSLYSLSDLRRKHKSWAQASLQESPEQWNFRGTAEDYARASYVIEAIAKARGLSGLMDVYEEVEKKGVTLPIAVRSEIGWNEERLQDEVKKAVARD